MALGQDNGTDLQTATDALAQQADTVRRIIAQAAGKDPAQLALLRDAVASAKDARAYYTANVPAVDTTELDAVLAEANAALGGSVGGFLSTLFQRDGVHLGKLVIPWIAAGAVVLFAGAAIAVPMRRRRRRRAARR